MKRFFAVFVLTPAEQRLIIFAVLLMVAAAWLKQQRDLKYNASPQPAPLPTPIISPWPGT